MSFIPFPHIEQLHQDIEVYPVDVSAVQSAGTVPAIGELLFPVLAGAPADTCDILADSGDDSDSLDRSADADCREGCLRRYRKYICEIYICM